MGIDIELAPGRVELDLKSDAAGEESGALSLVWFLLIKSGGRAQITQRVAEDMEDAFRGVLVIEVDDAGTITLEAS